MHVRSSNELIADNQFIPWITTLSTSSNFPTVTLDLTENRPNPVLQFQPTHLEAVNFNHSTPLSNEMNQALDKDELGNYSSFMHDYVASITEDPNFIAALSVAITGSILK
jgi:hypothetical protein